MAEMQKVSWRTVGYVALGTAGIIAAAVGIVHSDGVRPISLKSSAATRWLVYQPKQLLVLADGLSGRVLAKIDAKVDAKSETTDEIAVQGAGGAFLVAPSLGTVRAISTANLQLGTPQVVGSLSSTRTNFDLGVGTNGLTVVNTETNEAHIVPTGDLTRRIKVTEADSAQVARDGSIWLFSQTGVTHVNVDESSTNFPLRGHADATTTVGSHGVSLDRKAQVVRWLDGGDVSIGSIPNLADAVLQVKGDDASCVWLGAGNTLACVGATGIDRKLQVAGLNLGVGDRLAVAGATAVVVRDDNRIQRVDLAAGTLLKAGNPERVPTTTALTITAGNGMIWIDEEKGDSAWVIQQFGAKQIHKNDTSAPTVNAQGQVTDPGSENGPDPGDGGNAPGDDAETDHLDHNGVDDPPVAVDDSVTARAGSTVTIPVTANDFDPDGNAIAVVSVGDRNKAGHGTADVLDGTSVTYVPFLGYSGTDEFDYTIVDENGNTDSATVHLQLFPADSPNRPPIATPDHVKTRLGRAVTIDVLSNDIDPERDMLTVRTFGENGSAKITDTSGPTRLPALRYQPPDTPGVYTFTYQAADPQGGTSAKTRVTVDVLGDDAANEPPNANPDAIRLPVGKTGSLDVKANDVDVDGDALTIGAVTKAPGVDVTVRSQLLFITLQPGADDLSVIYYALNDGTGATGHTQRGHVLVVRIPDTAPNRPPVANPDVERVVLGNTVKIPVTANDADPDLDPIRLLSVEQPDNGAGTTTVEGNSVRFAPKLPEISESTPVSFTYKIGDGHGNVAVGNVTVTVLVQALPNAPFARDDFADTITDKPVNIDVRANDTDPSGGLPSIAGQPVCPNGGVASTTAEQRVIFVPPPGLTGTFRCKYRVSNTEGEAEAWIIVTVTDPPPGNRDPEFVQAQLTQSVIIGQSLTLNAADIATDADGNTLAFASVSGQGVGSTNFTQKAASFTYTAPLARSNDTPTDVALDVTITDGHDGYVRGQISIKINDNTPVLPAPPHTIDLRQVTSLDQPPVIIDVPAALKDLNDGVILSLRSASVDSGPATTSVKDGVVTITPTAAGTVVVTYVVANDQQQSTGKIILTVNEPPVVNPPPVAVDDELVVSSGGSGIVNLLANDEGIADLNDEPSATLINRPPASFGTVQLVNGFLRLIAAPDVVEKHATVNYALSDGNGPPVTGAVRLTILACAESPPSVRPGFEFTPYATPFAIDLKQYVLSGDIVPGSIEGAGLTGPTGTYTPPTGMNDSVTVTYLVANGCGETVPGQLTIDVNKAPVATSIAREMSQGDSLTLLATQLASDDEKLTIQSIDGNPAWATLVAGADGPTLNIVPPAGTPSGAYHFTATVVDPGELSAVATINLTITNIAPTAVADAYYTDGAQYLFDPTVNDFDSEPGPLRVLTIAAADGSGTVLTQTGNWITVSVGHGVSHFNYTIIDSGGLTSSSTITITSNRPPTVDNPPPAITDQPTVEIELSPTDPDGDPLTVTCSPVPNILDIVVTEDPGSPNKFTLHITVLNNFTGTVGFFCDVVDSFGAHADPSPQISLSVDPQPS